MRRGLVVAVVLVSVSACGARDGLPEHGASVGGESPVCTPRTLVTSREDVVAFDVDATTVVWGMRGGGVYLQQLGALSGPPRLRATVEYPTSVYLRTNDVLVTTSHELLSFDRWTDGPPVVLATGGDLRDVQAGPNYVVYFDGSNLQPSSTLYQLGTGAPLPVDTGLTGGATGILYGNDVWLSDQGVWRWDLETRTKTRVADSGALVAVDGDQWFIAQRPLIGSGALVAKSRSDGTERTLIEGWLPWTVALDGDVVYAVLGSQLGDMSLVRWQRGRMETLATPGFDRAYYAALRVTTQGLLVSTRTHGSSVLVPIPRLQLLCK